MASRDGRINRFTLAWWKVQAVLLWRAYAQGDRHSRFRLLQSASEVLSPTYRFVDPRLDWWHHDGFNAYLRQFEEDALLNMPRKWMLGQLLRMAASVEGDTAECGVYRGASSWLICAANARTGKTHHVFDSFQGLSAPRAADGSHWVAGGLACDEAEVRRALASFPLVRYYAGWIPDRFSEVAHHTFSFVHIDVDLEQPTADSVAFFYSRLHDGGVLVSDDYGQAVCPGATKAIDAYLADKPEQMLALPDGGGFLVKGRPTAPLAL